MAKNRALKARMLRDKRRGKFKNWKNNPKGGTQAPLRAYSLKRYSTISKDVELFHGQTLGSRAAKAQTTVRIPSKAGSSLTKDVFDIPVPPTKNLTFGRVINTEEGPIPRLVVLDKMRQQEKEHWFQDREYDKWAEAFHKIRIIKSPIQVVDIFFSGRIFVIVEVTKKWARRSVIYHSFHHAKRTWDRKRVRWVELVEV